MPDSALDSLSEISRIDKSSMLSFQVKAADHYKKALRIAEKVTVDNEVPKNVIVAGMGGSAIGGELAKDWARNKASAQIEVCRDYFLPKYAGSKTLVLASSYSGETEETLSAFLDARKKGCQECSK